MERKRRADFFAENLSDEELVQRIAEADTPTAVGLLPQEGLKLLAVKLWRQRTGDDLKTALEAVQTIDAARQSPPDATTNR